MRTTGVVVDHKCSSVGKQSLRMSISVLEENVAVGPDVGVTASVPCFPNDLDLVRM